MNLTTTSPMYDSALALFVCGLAWLAGGVLIAQGRIPDNWRSPRPWLLLAAFALWLENWLQAALIRGFGPRTMFAVLCAALWALAAVATVECSARRCKHSPLWTPQRWVYIPLLLWTAFSSCYLRGEWLGISYQLLFAWTVIGIALRTAISVRQRPVSGWGLISLASIVAYSVLVCCQLWELAALAALMSLIGSWRGQRASDRQARLAGRENGRPAPVWRRLAMPAAFVLALAAGWMLIGAGGAPLVDEIALAPEPNLEQLFAELEGEVAPPADDEFERQLKRCGTAAAPILGMVLAVWGLSRLPFAR
jgi:hypothetical protein